MNSLESFIAKIDHKLGDFVSAVEIDSHGIATRTLMQRLRDSGEGPPYFRMSSGQIKYLKKDIFTWLRSSYKTPKKGIEASKEEKKSNPTKKKSLGAKK